jgi:hypothetical protein
MASKTCRQLVAVAALAGATMTMGGTAFASTVGDASESARSAVADIRNQIHRQHDAGVTGALLPGPVGDASETARSTAADVRNQIHRQQW